ncbi:hypothetical protein P170DRAFT_288062 [Aspergillus steynii IBT 23096]|uniref:Uncharacterized protein n=1 Tax=Aspergillus steynii IBT 23096 TaxID=1392250 RepID=A0A2I2FV83_9EURO|nr:uncharacterized protein P170DRAFT_288062 [Aspergillus steynii IBT 23096]PLB44534.1 hypothetical protein P170DRAFT_288062 [Aspergillus steynii IBT 23096]
MKHPECSIPRGEGEQFRVQTPLESSILRTRKVIHRVHHPNKQRSTATAQPTPTSHGAELLMKRSTSVEPSAEQPTPSSKRKPNPSSQTNKNNPPQTISHDKNNNDRSSFSPPAQPLTVPRRADRTTAT